MKGRAMYKFSDKYNLGAPYIYIHPFKQLAVKKLADNAPEGLDCIIIFGSAVTPACWYGSDIDVCLIGRNIEWAQTDAMRSKGQAYDFLTYPDFENLIAISANDKFNVESDILRDGVIVYERKDNAS